jgi:glycosyltransferase involved in cell wall biosynthesis
MPPCAHFAADATPVQENEMRILIAPVGSDVVQARSTIRGAARAGHASDVTVLALTKSYVRVGSEQLLCPDDIDVTAAELHSAAIELEPDQLGRWLTFALVQQLVRAGDTVLLVTPGVELLRDPAALLDATEHPLSVVPQLGAPPHDLLRPGLREALSASLHSSHISMWRPGSEPAIALALAVARRWDGDGREIDAAASLVPHGRLTGPAALLSAWSLRPTTSITRVDGRLHADGARVSAFDLSSFDHHRPWTIERPTRSNARALLSDHPVLAALSRDIAAEREADELELGLHAADDSFPFMRTAAGGPVHAHLRTIYRRSSEPRALAPADDPDPVPDPFVDGERLTRWLLEPLPRGHAQPVARYLAETYAARPDLASAFPLVPGADTGSLLTWAADHAPQDGIYDLSLLDASVRASRTAAEPVEPAGEDGSAEGVTVVGYLAGELGVGESARLMLSALSAGGVPHATVPVAHQLQSRQQAQFPAARPSRLFDATLLCVNADQTPGLMQALGGRYDHTHRIGMWYWELEEFPVEQRPALDLVNEVWAATDFIRDAISPHSHVPVRTVTPPLPQRHVRPLPPAPMSADVARNPVFLFAFDYLSGAERKNPWGVVDAFDRAFAPGEGPTLVLKSINAERDLASSERLRLLVAERPDIVLIERYLSADERDSLIASCTAYISLHRAEGLGLTLAEAMAWGKPVIATGYSGNLQFMNPSNSILVPWTPTKVPDGCEPYPPGALWAEPDIDAAAVAMRRVVDEPRWAEALGRQAAADLLTHHSPRAAAERIASRLREISAESKADGRGAPGVLGRAKRVLRRQH